MRSLLNRYRKLKRGQEEMTIEEMKDRIVEDQIAYIRDLVFKDRHEELFGFVDENIFSSFKGIDDDEIKCWFKEVCDE